MSPLIDIQRRMAEVGRIRAGDKTEKGTPRKLANWRLTSKDKVRLEQAQQLWGGKLTEWGEEWQLHTDTNALPIMLLPGHPPTSWYELWSAGGCQRRCDGRHELISDSACLCGDERECKPTTRLPVLLPDIPGIGSWLLSSTGWNAAAELAGSADLLNRASAQGVLIPARLRLEQRTSIRAGQTRKFAVPVIDIDVSIRQLLGGEQGSSPLAELPAGYTPIPERPGNGTSLSEGLEIAHTQQITRKGKGVTPQPQLDDIEAEQPAPGSPPAAASKAQRDKLNVLVGTLRDSGHLRTQHLYSAIASSRQIDTETMTELIHGRDEQGELHWAPLRDSLTKTEAHDLIDRLERLEANAKATQ